jgi:hypothetical protein
MIVDRKISIIYPFERKKMNCLTVIMEENNFTLHRCWLNEFEKTKSEINKIIDFYELKFGNKFIKKLIFRLIVIVRFS